jgi:hypothetical protein
MGMTISVSVDNIQRVIGQNQGILLFNVYPALLNINLMNLSYYVSLKCNSNFTIEQISYSDGILKLNVNYTDDMEGDTCNLTMAYNYSIIWSRSSNITFQVKSSNVPLIYSSNSSSYSRFVYIFTIISYCVLAIFVLSLPSKMVGP